MRGLTHVLQALGRHPTLTKLGLHACRLGRDEARLLRMALSNLPNLQSLLLRVGTLESAGLAELAPALYPNTSVKVIDISGNYLNIMESAGLLRDILRRNKSITALDLSWNRFGQTTGALDYIADGLGSNLTLLKIHLSNCDLGDGGVSTLARKLDSRSSMLQKLTLQYNSITSTGVGVLLEAMEHNSLDTMERSCHITDLDLGYNHIGNEGGRLLSQDFGKQRVTKPHAPRPFFMRNRQ
jgi:Ran GTPase-activating protein (RanGAP) involved in mRNA processing and transport